MSVQCICSTVQCSVTLTGTGEVMSAMAVGGGGAPREELTTEEHMDHIVVVLMVVVMHLWRNSQLKNTGLTW